MAKAIGETDFIRYNLLNRERTFSGIQRQPDVAKLVKVVADAEFQERIKKGDVVGYLGHDIRRQFGINPAEVGVFDGKLIALEPAFVTTHLKVFADGTVEHKARFLDSPLGRKAWEWHQAGLGGFSSVVSPSLSKPQRWDGFDFVLSPNYHANRGYATMDSTEEAHVFNRLTNKQKYTLLQARAAEQEAVMDALCQSSSRLQASNRDLALLNKQLSATVDCLAEQLAQVQATEEAHTPLMRVSVDNWLQTSLASMDDIRKFDCQPTHHQTDNVEKLFKYVGR